ncbi:MAG: hypothetical protein PUB25_07630 [Lachnospiraceae bacterium]|nr:hypothetical protein [Lachnospiraceae bacterium]
MTDSEKLDLLIEDMGTMKTEIGTIKTEIGTMKTEMQTIKTEMGTMKQDIRELKKDTANIKLQIENEIIVNIKRVAEGHLDLSRNLHEAMKPNQEVEMLAIKVRGLQTDVREIKQKLS